jgi:hypothetical protein
VARTGYAPQATEPLMEGRPIVYSEGGLVVEYPDGHHLRVRRHERYDAQGGDSALHLRGARAPSPRTPVTLILAVLAGRNGSGKAASCGPCTGRALVPTGSPPATAGSGKRDVGGKSAVGQDTPP